jgi:hypothetical protein
MAVALDEGGVVGQQALWFGGHRLVDAGHTPNGLYRLLVCERCGGQILARTPDEAGGEIGVWSCTCERVCDRQSTQERLTRTC